jgi:cytochrome oxidase Cu insertion factor (SCO1/SenC/PrrC family)
MRLAVIRTLAGLLLYGAALPGCQSAEPPLGHVADFQLIERSGKSVSRDDLEGKVWVAAFFFTRCAGPCTQLSGAMAKLQDQLASQKDARLVSFTVDPDHDTPEVLSAYANKFAADPERWLFLTGDRAKLYALIQDSFKLGVAQAEGTARTPGNEVLHSTRLVVVDRHGNIRGYFDGTDEKALGELRKKVGTLLREKD